MNESSSAEQWRPVVGYEGLYEVSDHGNVRSLDREVRKANRWGGVSVCTLIGKPLASKADRGYRQVTLSRDGVPWDVRVHTLVLTAFDGPRPVGCEALHGDGDGSNNVRRNLRWGTSSENGLDTVAHGMHHYASRPRCTRGHLYAGRNLALVQAARVCRACRYANRHAVTESDRAALADRKYDEIMGVTA